MSLNSALECAKKSRIKRENLGKCNHCNNLKSKNTKTCDYHRGYDSGRMVLNNKINFLTFKLKELEIKLKTYMEGDKA